MTHEPKPPRPIAAAKYARGESAPRAPGSRRLTVLEWLVCLHVAILLVWTTWAFGGGAEWMRPYFAASGGLGVPLAFAAVLTRERARPGALRPLLWLCPIAAFNALVLVAALKPSLREINFDGETLLAHLPGPLWQPSSARPQLAISALLLFDGLWLACFNVALVIRQRRAVRGLLLLAAINALALAVFGTVQKLSQASGIYFGAVSTKQPYFFGPFVYHNHWGAFTLLMLCVCLGLAWHYARRSESRNFFHSPAFGGLVAVLLLAATIPLSGSRSCTLFLSALCVLSITHLVTRLIRTRRRNNESIVPPLAGIATALALGVGAIWYVGRDTITKRANLTRDQVSTMLAQGSIGARVDLYRNTWRMAADKPLFGWGMASYPHVFSRFYNTQSSVDRLPVFYRDAHNDWLQAIAEHGFVGCALLALAVVLPLCTLRRRHFASPLPAYLLGGCALLLLYAWLEFPFANVSVVVAWWLCFYCAVTYARLQDRDNDHSSGIAQP